jgi:tetrahydromethanopterin S-methyltransferase subunit B
MINEELIEFELKTFDEKIKNLEKKQEGFNQELKCQREMLNAFDTTQQLILQKLDTIIDTIDKLTKDTEAQKLMPSKNWDKAKWIIISSILTAIVTGIITMIVK